VVGEQISKSFLIFNKNLIFRCYPYHEISFAVWRKMGEAVDNLIPKLGISQNTLGFLNKFITFSRFIRYIYRANPQAVLKTMLMEVDGER